MYVVTESFSAVQNQKVPYGKCAIAEKYCPNTAGYRTIKFTLSGKAVMDPIVQKSG